MRNVGLMFAFVVWVASVAAAQATTRPAVIAVVSSFPEELEAIERLLAIDPNQISATSINGVDFKSVDVGGRRCLFFVTGMSLVNAAMNTQLAIDRMNVSAILFTGIAGGVDPALNPGDVVIPQRWHYHGESAYFNETAPGEFALADYFKPKHGHFGMIFPDDVTVKRAGMTKWAQQDAFVADDQLLAVARTATRDLLSMKFGDRVCKVIVGGDGVSGTVFCDNAAYREFVFTTWQAECLDMESTAIAHVCWQNQTPFLIVRGLSDLAGGQHGKNTVDQYLDVAARNASTVLARIVTQLPSTNGRQ